MLAMLSDLILEHNGKATSNRVLDEDIQSRETTVTAMGKVRGVDVSIIINTGKCQDLMVMLLRLPHILLLW